MIGVSTTSLQSATRLQSLGRPTAGLATPVGAAIASVAVSLPEPVVDSELLDARLGLPPGWIQRRTGIRQRRIAAPGERLDEHAARAGQRALRAAGIVAGELDMVVVATSTADELMPAAAPLVAHALGAHRAGAFDVGAACTGFLSALSTASAQIECGRARAILVIGADLMSRITDPDDRATAAVFADAAGAAVLVADGERGRIGPIVLGCDGAGADHIRVARQRATIEMRGHETFREAVARLSACTLQALAAAEVSLEEIDLFVYHQANSRILAAVGSRLGIAEERLVDCIGPYGNTGAATLPLALWHAERDGRLHAGDLVLLGAFGAGFTWGATVLEWGATA